MNEDLAEIENNSNTQAMQDNFCGRVGGVLLIEWWK